MLVTLFVALALITAVVAVVMIRIIRYELAGRPDLQ